MYFLSGSVFSLDIQNNSGFKSSRKKMDPDSQPPEKKWIRIRPDPQLCLVLHPTAEHDKNDNDKLVLKRD